MDIEIRHSDAFNYIIGFPEGYKEGEKYPVIIFLHGAGTRGNNIKTLINNMFFNAVENFDFPFVTVAPQCSENTWFDMFERLKDFACEIVNEDFCDKERVYLMGASMGGYATWQLAMSMPELFSAIVPICGGGMYWNAERLINVPVWAFHGAKDDVVFCEESEKMVNAVNACGGNARLTVYPENGHNAWTDTYSNPEVFKWLLSHTNKNASEIQDMFTDGKIYG